MMGRRRPVSGRCRAALTDRLRLVNSTSTGEHYAAVGGTGGFSVHAGARRWRHQFYLREADEGSSVRRDEDTTNPCFLPWPMPGSYCGAQIESGLFPLEAYERNSV
jgi:hypothetical protein